MSKTKKIDLTKSNGSLDKVSAQNISIKTDITSPTSEEKPETTKEIQYNMSPYVRLLRKVICELSAN